MYDRSKNETKNFFCFIFIDIIFVLLSYYIAYFLVSNGDFILSNELLRRFGYILSVIWLVVIMINKSYKKIFIRDYKKEFVCVLTDNAMFFVFLLFYLFLTKDFIYISRRALILFVVFSVVTLYFEHLILKFILKKYFHSLKNRQSLLIITSKYKASDIIKNISENYYSKYRICGVIVLDIDYTYEVIQGLNVVADKNDMLEFIKKNWVDEVFIEVDDDIRPSDDLLDGCAQMGVTVHIKIKPSSNSIPRKYLVEQFAGVPVLTQSIAVITAKQLFLKRTLDIFGAVIGLLCTGIFFIIFAPIIYYQSKGPILFKQTRVGLNGKKFKIYKFRSMHIDAENRKRELMSLNKMNGLMFKMDDDPRIIPIGKLLRKLSIDEFPQFLNVLKGDMSIVGTRPPTVDEYERYELHHKARLATKPGITGNWQISGRSNITDFEEIVKLDKDYIEYWSLGRDILIILKTFSSVLKRNGSV